MNKNISDEKLPRFIDNQKLRNMGVIFLIAQIFAILFSFFVSIPLGFILVLLFILSLLFFKNASEEFFYEINQYILNLSYRIKRGEQEALIKMPIGILMLNNEGDVDWVNPYMLTELSDNEIVGRKLKDIDEDLYRELENVKETDMYTIRWNEKIYQVHAQNDIHVIYLMDVTEYAQIKERYEEDRPVIGYLFFDNYDELTQGLDDRAVSSFDNMLTTYLSNWGKQHGIFYKRISDDRYFLLMDRKELRRMENERFSIIDNIRERTSKRNLPLTISIGLTYGSATFDQLADLAQNNLDLALGRGGDQAVVKPIDGDPRYYGGKTNPMEKRTRVRSRMISQAMQDIMLETDNIFVMGHKNPDMDAIGSSLGIQRIAKMHHKACWIVIDKEDLGADVTKLMAEIEKDSQISRYIISPEVAEEMVTPESLIVLVDHHKPSMSIAPNLLKKTKKNMVIDHHRRGEEFVDSPLLVYIEPYASSTAELITELFEYVPTEGDPINKIEATALLGGIIVDTNNFSLRTGSRTFDAASYLQSVGANSTLIQRMLKEDPEVYLKRSHLIETMEFVEENYAIAHGNEDVLYHPVVAAQTADTMLAMTNVEASFVITRRDSKTVGISARSLGKINVQRIMEKMGGGGHLSNAATQISDQSIEEVKQQLIDALHEYKNN
ncbi:DHH family phosphoesterase [Lacticigenium naphthae]|uniref:DHH family phosphoesterase n=1 Tax=Lacticigenium naphthae TaxID=515351 RepID=UPI0004231767|nr:DHH family phosphoesterase [Lacticigenium naphthae]